MSYDTKIQAAQKIIDEHNSNAEQSDQVNFEQFMEKLRKAGGTSDDTLKACSWEDIQQCGAPRLIARRVAYIFRQENGGSGKSGYISMKKAETLTSRELLERYNPRESKNAVAKKLKDISDNKPFIVFSEGNKVDIETSERLLNDLREGLPEVTITFVNSIPTPVYKVGDRPDNFLDENPIYPKRILRSGQTCDQTGRSWNGVPTEVRQLLWLSIEVTKELKITSLDNAHNVMDMAVAKDCMSLLRGRYPKASLKFDELSQTGELPSLKIQTGKDQTVKKNDPFYKNITT